jgi:hypothetical protein
MFGFKQDNRQTTLSFSTVKYVSFYYNLKLNQMFNNFLLAKCSSKGVEPHGDDSDEDYVPPPTYQSTFADAFAIAISQGLEDHLKTGA